MNIGDKRMELLRSLWPSKIRYQLILGVAAVHLTLMTLFVFDLMERQRDFLLNQSLEETRSLVHTLAINSSSWVLANDVMGLGELINSMQRHTELHYAMVIDQDGKVLAHTDRSKVGLYVKDARSLALLKAKPEIMTLYSDRALLDVAAPVFSSTGERIGWARIGHGQENIVRSLSIVSKNGILYILLAILVGSVFATLIGYRLTSGLSRLLSVSGQIRNGRRDLRMDITRDDEISGLGRGLNQMLDSMVAGEHEIQDLYNNAPCGYHSLDKDGNFVRINDTELKWLGYTREEMVGKMRFTDVVTPKGIETFREHFPLFTKHGQMRDLEYDMVRKDGTILPVLLSATAIYDVSGNYLMSRGTVYDITERRKAEEELNHFSQRNEMILNSVGEGIYGTDVNGNILFVNPAAAEMLGFRIEEFIGKKSHQLFHHTKADGSSYPLGECPLHKSLTEGEVRRGQEEVFWTKKGKKIYVEHVNTPLIENGRVVGAVVVFQDITDRRKADEAIRLTGAYHRTLIESSLDPLVTIGPDGKITDVNSSTESVTGYDREKLIGTDFSDYFTEPDKAKAGYQQVFRDGTVRDYALEIRHRNGHVTPVLYNASVYRNETGDVIGVFAAARDITERKRAEEELGRLNQELEQRVEERTEELKAKNEELQKMNKLFVGRELRMIELKEMIKELEKPDNLGGPT